jgi:hypothetical protein
MALKGTTFGKDDIAAMEVISDRKAGFTHRLNLAGVDIRWILDLQPIVVKQPRPSTPVRSAPSALDNVSPVRGDGDAGQSMVVEEQPQGATTNEEYQHPNPSEPHPGWEKVERHKREHHSQPRTARSESGFSAATTTSTVRRGRKAFQFAPPPLDFFTLDMLDRTQVVLPSSSTDNNMSVTGGKAPVLINTPRSAYILLKNGFSLSDLCGVPVQEYYNKALLDGATLETVKMRIAAEDERRAKRFNSLLKVYSQLCANVSREEVVDAIRAHKYAEDIHKEEDEERLRSIPHYAHAGKFDLTILDSDCVDVLQKSRARTMMEIRRSMDQRDRLQKHSIEKENDLMERERAAQEEFLRVQQDNSVARAERAEQLKARRGEVERRVEKLLQTQEELTEMRRQALIEQDQLLSQRAKEKKELQKTASLAMIDERERRRRQVREENSSMMEERRAELIQKAEMQALMKERENELKRARQMERSRAKTEHAEKRRQTIKQLSEEAAAARKQKQFEMESMAEARSEEFARRRQLRQIAKRIRANQKAERTAAIREQGEHIKQHRMEELEREYQEKLKGIEQAQEEKKERIVLTKEMNAQVQLEKVEEKERATMADEFSKIAYVSSSNAKQRWMERAEQKRVVLTAHVRQEREAMMRAKEQVFLEMEAEEIRRRKKAAAAMLMYVK